ncbi:MAG: nucleotidyltransferase domain-containing protein [Elusimicrobiota bacterium]
MIGHLIKEEEEAVKKVAQKIKELLGSRLLLLELFGSKARGNFRPDSDIDIFVVVKDKDIALRDKLYDILFDIDPDYRYRMSLIIYSKFEFEQNIKLRSPFVENIQQEGVVL